MLIYLSLNSKVTDSGMRCRVTLAERLNELAMANADGLLRYVSSYGIFIVLILVYSEDEYRMLRQNLFERFSSVSNIPTENPIVPAMLPRLQPVGTRRNKPEKGMQNPYAFGAAELKVVTILQLVHGLYQTFKWNYHNPHLHRQQDIH